MTEHANKLHLDLDHIRNRVRAGETLQSIADALGVSKGTIHDRVSAAGIPRWPSGVRRTLPPVEALAKFAASGKLLREIGALYGVTGEAVGDAFRRAGYRRVDGVYRKIEPA